MASKYLVFLTPRSTFMNFVGNISALSYRTEDNKVRNPYRWLPRKDEKEKDKTDKKKGGDRRPTSPSEVSGLFFIPGIL